MVRARARGGDNSILPKITTTNIDELRAIIHQERRIELAMEWERFYDLVRWDEAKNVIPNFVLTNSGYDINHRKPWISFTILTVMMTELNYKNAFLMLCFYQRQYSHTLTLLCEWEWHSLFEIWTI